MHHSALLQPKLEKKPNMHSKSKEIVEEQVQCVPVTPLKWAYCPVLQSIMYVVPTVKKDVRHGVGTEMVDNVNFIFEIALNLSR